MFRFLLYSISPCLPLMFQFLYFSKDVDAHVFDKHQTGVLCKVQTKEWIINCKGVFGREIWEERKGNGNGFPCLVG